MKFSYNHEALKLHTRKIVSESYEDWDASGSVKLSCLLDPQDPKFELVKSRKFVDCLEDFIVRPIFTEEMSGFASFSELLATFIGINTVRVELTKADVVRSHIVDGLLSRGASSTDVLEVDNKFKKIFLTAKGNIRGGFSPLIESLKEDIEGDVFAIIPSLNSSNTKPSQVLNEFNELVDWLEQMEQGLSSSPYLEFLKALGDNPFVASVMYFFQLHRRNNTLGQLPPDADLHRLLM